LGLDFPLITGVYIDSSPGNISNSFRWFPKKKFLLREKNYWELYFFAKYAEISSMFFFFFNAAASSLVGPVVPAALEPLTEFRSVVPAIISPLFLFLIFCSACFSIPALTLSIIAFTASSKDLVASDTWYAELTEDLIESDFFSISAISFSNPFNFKRRSKVVLSLTVLTEYPRSLYAEVSPLYLETDTVSSFGISVWIIAFISSLRGKMEELIKEVRAWLRAHGDYDIKISLHGLYGVIEVRGFKLNKEIAFSKGQDFNKHIKIVLGLLIADSTT